MSSDPINATLCKSLDPDDFSGCLSDFPNKTVPGLCRLCALTEKFASDEEKLAALKTVIQCIDCGAVSRSFIEERCGICRQAYRDRTDQSRIAETVRRNTVDAARIARSDAFQARVADPRKQVAATPSISSSQHALSQVRNRPTIHTSTTAMAPLHDPSAVRVATDGGRMIEVEVEPKPATGSTRKAARVYFLGAITRSFSEHTELSVVIDSCIESWNLQWDRVASSSLIKDDLLIRWRGGKELEPGTTDSTLGHLYDAHNNCPHRQQYYPHKPRKGELPRVFLDLLIDLPGYERRTGMTAPELEVRTRKNAKRSADATASESLKRPRYHEVGPMVSTFIPSRALPRKEFDGQDITCQIATMTLDDDDGSLSVSWYHDDADIQNGTISESKCGNGQSKYVYKIKLGSEDYVAKRFYNIGDGPDNVSIGRNAFYLELEANRLLLGANLFAKFLQRAQETGTEVAKCFEFTKVMLAREFLEADQEPSTASGVRESEFVQACKEDPDVAITWLLEPQRSVSVRRWSGTLAFTNRPDKNGQTINTFVHFAYEWTQKSVVFADIQSSPGPLSSRDARGEILFDVMTHTATGDSGVGDHGQKGIDAFKEAHVCQHMCQSMGLRPLDVSVELDDGSDSEKGSDGDSLYGST